MEFVTVRRLCQKVEACFLSSVLDLRSSIKRHKQQHTPTQNKDRSLHDSWDIGGPGTEADVVTIRIYELTPCCIMIICFYFDENAMLMLSLNKQNQTLISFMDYSIFYSITLETVTISIYLCITRPCGVGWWILKPMMNGRRSFSHGTRDTQPAHVCWSGLLPRQTSSCLISPAPLICRH